MKTADAMCSTSSESSGPRTNTILCLGREPAVLLPNAYRRRAQDPTAADVAALQE